MNTVPGSVMGSIENSGRTETAPPLPSWGGLSEVKTDFPRDDSDWARLGWGIPEGVPESRGWWLMRASRRRGGLNCALEIQTRVTGSRFHSHK